MGFDTSLTITGVAQIDLGVGADGQIEPVQWLWARPRTTVVEDGTVLTTRRRQRQMLREILALVPETFDLAVVEGAAMSYGKHSGLADERAGLRWMLIDQLLPRGPVVLASPKTRTILATDNGNADKASVHAAALQLFPAAEIPATGAGRYDVADAAVLAAAGAHRLGMPWPVPMSKKQTLAHSKVPWPTETAA
ncbi:hypothetical protein SAMN04488590_0261 [Microbacterium sp. 77mftsu3.1]|nr:hypothetical protein SAMN04488590_0261 [Microbacterium sp. 77mftsu3.1]